MIHLTTEKSTLGKWTDNRTFINTAYKYFNLIGYNNKRVKQEVVDIVKNIDESDIIDNCILISRFNGASLPVDKISDGAKVVAYISDYCTRGSDNEVIDITPCGSNAIDYIINTYYENDLYLYLNHWFIPNNDKHKVDFNNKQMYLSEFYRDEDDDEE